MEEMFIRLVCEDWMGLEECEEQASKDRKPEPLGIQVRQY